MENRCYTCMRKVAPGTNRCPHCGSDIPCRQSSPNALQPGTIIMNRFIVGHEQGHGGFGITYIAYDTQLQTVRALKEFFPQRGCTRRPDLSPEIQPGFEETFERNRQHFLHEARIMMEADSRKIENIVKIVDIFNLNGTSYILMEYLTGSTVDQYIGKNGPMTAEQAIPVFLEAMKALDGLHKAGILHRDVSMSNIFMLDNGEVKLIDLGSAEHLSDAAKSPEKLWPSRKEDYSPIEQIKKKQQGTYTDVYAAAVTLFKMIARRSPGTQPGDPLPPISRVLEKRELSFLDPILIAATQREPAQRTQTVEALVRPLMPKQKKKKGGRKKLLLIPLVAAAGAAAFLFLNNGADAPKEAGNTAASGTGTQAAVNVTPEVIVITAEPDQEAAETPVPYTQIEISRDAAPFSTDADGSRVVREGERLAFTGRAYGGATLTVVFNGKEENAYTVNVPRSGLWSVAPSPDELYPGQTNSMTVAYSNYTELSDRVNFLYEAREETASGPTAVPYTQIRIDSAEGTFVTDGLGIRYVREAETMTFSGSAYPGAPIVVSFNDDSTYPINVPGSGTWTLNISSSVLQSGLSYTMKVMYQDYDALSDQIDFSYKVMMTPEIEDAESIDRNTTVITGYAESEAQVTLYINGEAWGSPVTAKSGSGAFTFEGVSLKDAETIEVEASNLTGSVKRSGEVSVGEVQRAVLNISFEGGGSQTTMQIGPDGCRVNVTGEDGAEVVLTVADNPIQLTLANGNNPVQITPADLGMVNGRSYGITAAYADGEGGTTSQLTVTAVLEAGQINIDQVVNEETKSVTGSAKPGITVTMIREGEISRETTADPQSGEFTFPLSNLKADEVITFRGTDEFGNQTEDKTVRVTAVVLQPIQITTGAGRAYGSGDLPLTVAGTASPNRALVITLGGRANSLTSDGDGNWSAQITAGDVGASGTFSVSAAYADGRHASQSAAMTYQFDLECGATTADPVTEGETAVTGTGEAGATVTAYVNDTKLGEATVAGTGSYSITLNRAATAGETIVIRTTDAANNRGADQTVTVAQRKQPYAGGIEKIQTQDDTGNGEGMVQIIKPWVLGSTDVTKAYIEVTESGSGELIQKYTLEKGGDDDLETAAAKNPDVSSDVFWQTKRIQMKTEDGDITFGTEYTVTLYAETASGTFALDSKTFSLSGGSGEAAGNTSSDPIIVQSDGMYAMDFDAEITYSGKNVVISGYFYASADYEVKVEFYEGEDAAAPIPYKVSEKKSSRDSDTSVILALQEAPVTKTAGRSYTIRNMDSGVHYLIPKVRVTNNKTRTKVTYTLPAIRVDVP